MDKKKVTKIILIVLSIGLLVSLLLASTYALFSGESYGSNPNSYSTGLLSIEASSKSENISLTTALPMSDESGMQSNPYVFTIRNTGNLNYKFDVKLLSTSSNSFSSQYIKLQIDDGNVTNLSALTSGIVKKDVVLAAGESMDISIRIWLDENIPNTELGKSFESKIIIDGQAEYTYPETPLSDFTYFLGSEYSTVDTINYYDSYTDTYYNISVDPITLQPNEVLLVKYKGSSKNVVVPDTYTIDGTTYNVTVLSCIYILSDDGEVDDYDGIFMHNTNIEMVKLDKNIKSIYNDDVSDDIYENSISYMFSECTSLVNVLDLPSSVTDMTYTFYGCTSLVNVPEIPSSVTKMEITFCGCTSLVNAPEIPSSVTNMHSTFKGCTSLVNAPEIPSSVTDMGYTFYGCTSLVNAPAIPSSVTNMYYTFGGCTNLTGTVKINSSSVSSAPYIFNNTTNAINVLVPSGSTTYNTFSKLTTSNGMPSNVTLSTY